MVRLKIYILTDALGDALLKRLRCGGLSRARDARDCY